MTATISGLMLALAVPLAAQADSAVTTIAAASGATGNGFGQQGMALSPDGTRLYSLTSTGVAVIDTSTNTVIDNVVTPNPPTAVAVSLDGTMLYLTQPTADQVIAVNASTLATVATVAVGDGPVSLVATPDGSRIYVTNINGVGTSAVSVIDTTTNANVATIAAPSASRSIAVSPDGSRVYVSHISPGSFNVTVIETTTNAVVGTIANGTFANRADGIAFDPSGANAYLTHPGSDTVTVVDTATLVTESTISVGDNPNSIAITPDGTRAYVTNSTAGTVSTIDVATNTVVATVTVGAAPRSIRITPDGLLAYVANSTDASVSVIALDTFPAITTTSLPDGEEGSAYAQTIVSTGSPAPTLAVTTGSLPPGLALDPATGELTGTPTATGSFTFTVTASATVSGIASTVTQDYTLVIDPAPTPPGVPLALDAVLDGPDVALQWTTPSSDGGSPITGYRIERAIGSGSFAALVADTASTATTFVDSTVSGGIEYSYRVFALNGVGSSSASNVAAVAVPEPPTGLPTEPTGEHALAVTGSTVALMGPGLGATLLAFGALLLVTDRALRRRDRST
jgi:YVTN family beta-propeller protein